MPTDVAAVAVAMTLQRRLKPLYYGHNCSCWPLFRSVTSFGK